MKILKFIMRLIYVVFSLLMFPLVYLAEAAISIIVYRNNDYKKEIKKMYLVEYFTVEKNNNIVVVYKNPWDYLIKKAEYTGNKYDYSNFQRQKNQINNRKAKPITEDKEMLFFIFTLILVCYLAISLLISKI